MILTITINIQILGLQKGEILESEVLAPTVVKVTILLSHKNQGEYSGCSRSYRHAEGSNYYQETNLNEREKPGK